MNTLYDRILSDIKRAMLDKNTVKRDCLRSIVSEIKNQTVNAGKEITEDICLKAIQKSAKQHNDSIENFTAGNRVDLVEREREELSYISEYLPKTYDETETTRFIHNIMAEMNFTAEKKNMGQIMKQLKSNKSVDCKLAAKILNQILK